MYADGMAIQICSEYLTVTNNTLIATSMLIEDWTAANLKMVVPLK